MMNTDQIGSLVRSLALYGLGLLSVKLGLDNADVAGLAGAIAALAVALWGVWVKRSSATETKAS